MSITLVEVEGSRHRPSVHLSKGARATWTLTPHVQRLIAGGFVTVIRSWTNTPEAVEELAEDGPTEFGPDAPKLNAKTSEWKAFVESLNPPIEIPEGTERKDIQAAYAYWLQNPPTQVEETSSEE